MKIIFRTIIILIFLPLTVILLMFLKSSWDISQAMDAVALEESEWEQQVGKAREFYQLFSAKLEKNSSLMVIYKGDFAERFNPLKPKSITLNKAGDMTLLLAGMFDEKVMVKFHGLNKESVLVEVIHGDPMVREFPWYERPQSDERVFGNYWVDEVPVGGLSFERKDGFVRTLSFITATQQNRKLILGANLYPEEEIVILTWGELHESGMIDGEWSDKPKILSKSEVVLKSGQRIGERKLVDLEPAPVSRDEAINLYNNLLEYYQNHPDDFSSHFKKGKK